MPLIRMDGITRAYTVGDSQLVVLKGVSLMIEAGEFVAIMGASGSGKSTLMQIMGLLDQPTSGRYALDDRDVALLSESQMAALRSREIGFIFQMFNLLTRTSAQDNVALPMIYAGTQNRETRARELLAGVGLADRMDHHPNQLSGGQQQRVAIARALANRPRLLFADEPTGNLASDQSEDVLSQLDTLNRQGTTIVMVTHEPDIAAYAKRIIRLKDGNILSDSANESRTLPKEGLVTFATLMQGTANDRMRSLEPSPFSAAEFIEHVKSSLRAIGTNKVRSGLSILGILIGVASVITMLAIGKGAERAIEARLQSLGSNVVMLFAGAPSVRGVRGATGSYTRLTLEDVRAIKKVPNVSDIYGEVEADVRMVYGDQNSVSEVQGVPPNYESIRNSTPYFGRFFTERENLSEERVTLLGQTVVRNLFGSEDPVGKMVKFNRTNFRVIGVLPSKGGSGFSDQDDMAIIPLLTGMKRLFGKPYLHEMAIQCAETDAIPQMMQDIRRLMRKRHQLSVFKEDDFTLRNNAETQAALSGTTQTFSTLLGIVSAIALLVGGIGVMNIMLVSVNERTREIGLRKALGATRRAILIQFLLESTILAGLGGFAGIVFGIGVGVSLATLAGWASVVTAGAVLMAFIFSASIGILFGFWPAYKASLLSPIEALRYE